MKDKQVEHAGGEQRIFIVSTVLHCVSMTVLVYLRSSFGFVYLRPKSLFLAFSWAFLLYAVYAWMEGSVWQSRRGWLLFGVGSILLYWTHLLIAFRREWKQRGEHDHYSGRSHALRWLPIGPHRAEGEVEGTLHLWIEPGIVLVAAGFVRAIFGELLLSRWLLVAGLCLWIKEALNHWFAVRQGKRQQDAFADTEDAVEPQVVGSSINVPSKSARKAKLYRNRVGDKQS